MGLPSRERPGHLRLACHVKDGVVCFPTCNGKLLKGFQQESTFLSEKDEFGV